MVVFWPATGFTSPSTPALSGCGKHIKIRICQFKQASAANKFVIDRRIDPAC
jgi:hypothetical protein